MPIAPLGTFTYNIQPGDTLYLVAEKYNTTVSNILAFNSISDPDVIYPGREIVIPESPPEAIIYKVKSGDTLYSIAQEYGTQVDTIVEFNYLEDPNMINPGQKLVIPVSLR